MSKGVSVAWFLAPQTWPLLALARSPARISSESLRESISGWYVLPKYPHFLLAKRDSNLETWPQIK
jgi:hypothetical protein